MRTRAKKLVVQVILWLLWAGAVAVRADTRPVSSIQPGFASRAPGLTKEWLAQVARDIRHAECFITRTRGDSPDAEIIWQAPNRACDLRTYFMPNGIRMVRRAESDPSWQVDMHLAGFGYNGILQPAPPAERVADQNRLEYRRGPVTEWYVNEPRGLEQGFTIWAPESAGADLQTLDLELAVSGNCRVSQSGPTIEFTAPSGERVLTYGALSAYDATGRDLAARMALASAPQPIIRLSVEAAQARFPITIDPLFTSLGGLSTNATWTAESNQAEAGFGLSLGMAGDVNGDGYGDVIVGAYPFDNGETNEGRAFVYYSNAGSGLGLGLNQIKAGSGAPVASLGIPDAADGFRIVLKAFSPAGRDRVKLEWQGVPVGRPFGAAGTVSGISTQWLDTGLTITQRVSFPRVGPWQWRARLKYPPAHALGLRHTRWLSLPANAPTEQDLKIGGMELKILDFKVSGGNAQTTWTSLMGAEYQLRYRQNMPQTNWMDIGGVVTAATATASQWDPVMTVTQRFYGVLLKNTGR